MPNITIYLPNDLYDFVKKKNSPSKIIQEALREYKKKRGNEGKQV